MRVHVQKVFLRVKGDAGNLCYVLRSCPECFLTGYSSDDVKKEVSYGISRKEYACGQAI